MLLFSTPAVLIPLLVLCALHVAVLFFDRRAARILTFVNIGAHVLLVIPLLFCGFEFSEAVLVYMISLTVYTLSWYAKYIAVKCATEKNRKFFENYKNAEDKE